VVAGAQSCFTFLAAGRESAARQCATFGPLLDYRPHRTSTAVLPHHPKTRVGVFSGNPSGRLSRRRHFRSINTPGSRACAYKTASGRHEWPNRDPFGELGFETLRNVGADVVGDGPNLYEFVANRPINLTDPYGLCCDRKKCALVVAMVIADEAAAFDPGCKRSPGCEKEAIKNLMDAKDALKDACKDCSMGDFLPELGPIPKHPPHWPPVFSVP
jgi:hypothetical protein